MANLVDCHIAALIHHLCGHDHNLAAGNQLVHLFEEIPMSIAWDAADAVALDDDRIIMLPNPRQQAGVHAGDELEQKYLWIDVDIKCRIGAWAALPNIVDNFVVADGGKHREVDALERIEALGLHLLGTGAGNHLAVKDDADPVGIRTGGKAQGVEEVGLGIGDFH